MPTVGVSTRCRRGRAARWLTALLIGALACACSEAPRGYLPLQTGLRWDYTVTTTTRIKTSRRNFTLTNIGEARLNGERYQVRRSSSGTDYYLREDATGIYRGAKRTIVEDQPRLDAERRYVIKLPLDGGTEWRSTSHPYVLQRLHPYGESLTRNIEFRVTYRIAATDARVTVPAGRFENCLEVRGDALMTIYSDAVQGYTEIPITTREWYAPNVGLVRLERSETLDTTVFTGGNQVFELVRFYR